MSDELDKGESGRKVEEEEKKVQGNTWQEQFFCEEYVWFFSQLQCQT